jgi:predicted nucleic acid-binding protein
LANVLIDSSVWIEFFKKREPFHSAVLELMDANRVCCVGLILAELMQGAKSERELSVIRDFTHVFRFLPETPELWAKAGKLSYTLRRKGITVGLAEKLPSEKVRFNWHEMEYWSGCWNSN